jgi:hypothetical protein
LSALSRSKISPENKKPFLICDITIYRLSAELRPLS